MDILIQHYEPLFNHIMQEYGAAPSQDQMDNTIMVVKQLIETESKSKVYA